MKKRSKHRKLRRTSNERAQLYKNLLRSLALTGGIKTSEAKAAVIRPIAEKLVTLGKEESLTSFRRLMSETGSAEVAKRFLELGKLFKNRKGGYLRRIRMNAQSGDDTNIIYLEWVEKLIPVEVKKVEKVAPKKEVPAKEVETKNIEAKKEVSEPKVSAVKPKPKTKAKKK